MVLSGKHETAIVKPYVIKHLRETKAGTLWHFHDQFRNLKEFEFEETVNWLAKRGLSIAFRDTH